ncbi:hypothetical protein Q427_25645 [Halomonas sp. BC04]|nr:hypothetical protein Q427_25645 [Halomonas sp. BC04]
MKAVGMATLGAPAWGAFFHEIILLDAQGIDRDAIGEANAPQADMLGEVSARSEVSLASRHCVPTSAVD